MHGIMDIFTVCFFGHREIDNFKLVEEKVYEIVGNLIRSKEYVDFLVGRNGEFDQIVSSCVIRAKRNIFDANSSLVLILPYPTADYLNNEKYYDDYYDSIEIVNK